MVRDEVVFTKSKLLPSTAANSARVDWEAHRRQLVQYMAHARATQGIKPQEMFGILIAGPRVQLYRLRGRQNIVRD